MKKIEKDIEKTDNWPLSDNGFDIIVVTNFLNRSIFPLIINSINPFIPSDHFEL